MQMVTDSSEERSVLCCDDHHHEHVLLKYVPIVNLWPHEQFRAVRTARVAVYIIQTFVQNTHSYDCPRCESV